MNLNHFINMVTNQVIRRVVNIVVDRGINFASRKVAKSPKPITDQTTEPDITTPAELARDAQLRTMADKAAKTAQMARRTLR